MTVGPFVSEMDEAERLREKHETKRLLYVALDEGARPTLPGVGLRGWAMVPGRGSLGEVLPQSVKELFERAGLAGARMPDSDRPVTWTSASGARFEWCPCARAGGESLVS